MAADAPTTPGTPAVKPGAVLVLLLVAAVVGLVVSFCAWGFLESVHQIQTWVFDDLPGDVGFDTTPAWWPLPPLLVAGVITAFAIAKLPGNGGHIPAEGLKTGLTQPIALPGVILAALATLGFGIVLGPEAPLIALGSGLGIAAIRLVRRDAPDQLLAVVAAAGSFAALSFIFESPIIAAVVLLEAAGLDRKRMPVVLLPGLLAAGIGSLVSIGMGSWTGLSTSAYALGPLPLPVLDRPTAPEIAWTIPVAALIAVGAFAIFRGARQLTGVAGRRPFVMLPIVGLLVGGLAIAFDQATSKGFDEVLFSGQDQLPGFVAGASGWSAGALLLLLLCKGLAYSLSLSSFRGGPVFPSLFLGAAAGMLAAQLPGMSLTAGVAVGMGAATAATLRLPLSAVILAVLLTAKSGSGGQPLAIIGVVTAYLVVIVLSRRLGDGPGADEPEAPAADAQGAVVPAGSGP